MTWEEGRIDERERIIALVEGMKKEERNTDIGFIVDANYNLALNQVLEALRE